MFPGSREVDEMETYNHGVRIEALFIGVQGFRISRDAVYEATVEHAQSLGFHNPEGLLNEKFTPHCFRHWFTTWLRRSGCPPLDYSGAQRRFKKRSNRHL